MKCHCSQGRYIQTVDILKGTQQEGILWAGAVFPFQKVVIRLWSLLCKKHKTQSVFTKMGQRDNSAKGPTFLCMLAIHKFPKGLDQWLFSNLYH